MGVLTEDIVVGTFEDTARVLVRSSITLRFPIDVHFY